MFPHPTGKCRRQCNAARDPVPGVSGAIAPFHLARSARPDSLAECKRAATQRVKGDTSSPDGVARASICEHLDFEVLGGVVFPFVNANTSARRTTFTNVNIFQWTDLAPSVFDKAEAPGYFATRRLS